MFNETMLKAIHRFYRKDEWVNTLFNATENDLVNGDEKYNQDLANLFFDTLDSAGCEVLEKDLNITPRYNSTLEERRKLIQSKWLAKQFASLPTIQSIVDVFANGKVTADYAGDAEITYNVYHILEPIPYESEMLQAVDELKPAHIGHKFVYHYNKWKDFYFPMTWGTVKEKSWGDINQDKWKALANTRRTWGECKTHTWGGMLCDKLD